MAYANKKHAARRAQLEAERAERRRLDEEERRQRSRKRKSSQIPAKWRPAGSPPIRVAGVRITGGMFYSGCNKEGLVEQKVGEPSLVTPTLEIAPSSDDLGYVMEFPCYEYLTPEQRRGYIEFLASDRSSARDIGFVFLYIYGLERRLAVDARKPGEVGDEERAGLVAELLRLLRCFGDQSRSVCHYIGMLLLYDGSVFDSLERDAAARLFDLSDTTGTNKMKLFEYSDNSESMPYMLAARMEQRYGLFTREYSSNKEAPDCDKMPSYARPLLIAAAKSRLLRAPNFPSLGISRQSLFDPVLDKLLMERFCNAQVRDDDVNSARRVGADSPVYHTGSPSLRGARYRIEVTPGVCPDPEDLGVPLKIYADMVMAARLQLDACEAVVSSSGMRGMEDVKLDALAALAPANCALETFLAPKKDRNSIAVPMQVIDEDFRRRFGAPVQYSAKGRMTAASQQALAATAASFGWQVILPEAIDCPVSQYWRAEKDSAVIMFHRRRAHNRRTGVRCMSPMFGRDSSAFMLNLPSSWNDACVYSYIFAWFVKRCQGAFGEDDLTSIPYECYPPFEGSEKARTAQVYLFFSLTHACYSLSTSTRGIKSCLSAVPFETVQLAVFSLCQSRFGNALPPEVMVALEDVYAKAGRDKYMILHDYHSQDFRTSKSSAEFSIDEQKLADIIADSSSVHSILNEAMAVGTEDEIIIGSGADAGEPAVDERQQAPGPDGAEDDVVTGTMAAFESIFGGRDEMAAEELVGAIMEAFGASTRAEAMAVIADFNEAAGEELVEVDGADAYWNG